MNKFLLLAIAVVGGWWLLKKAPPEAPPVYTCTKCPATFPTWEKLWDHMVSEHPTEAVPPAPPAPPPPPPPPPPGLISLRFMVTDKETGGPVMGASITVAGVTKVTNVYGGCDFPLPRGHYSYKVSKPNYEPSTGDFDLLAAMEIKVSLKPVPVPIALPVPPAPPAVTLTQQEEEVVKAQARKRVAGLKVAVWAPGAPRPETEEQWELEYQSGVFHIRRNMLNMKARESPEGWAFIIKGFKFALHDYLPAEFRLSPAEYEERKRLMKLYAF